MSTETSLRRDVALANRIIERFGLSNAFGHVSARVPGTKKFLLPTRRSPGFAGADTLLVLDTDGKVLSGEGAPNSEHWIHGRLYAARPDIMSVVHAHPPACVCLTQIGQPHRIVHNQGGAFAGGIPEYDHIGLINCAGISHVGTVETTSEEDIDRLYNVNVKGVYNCLRAAIPLMKKNSGGVIINMCSVAATAGLPDRFAYSMTKGAVYSMTLSVAKDYLGEHIRCNCISPARVHTPFVDGFLKKNYPGREAEMFDKLSKTQPIGRMAEPDEIAGLVLYLCSDEAAFITGCDYPIDGGFLKLNN